MSQRTLFLTIHAFCAYDAVDPDEEGPRADQADTVLVGFPCRSGAMIREDGSIFDTEGNDWDSDDVALEPCVVEELLGRPLTDADQGKSFKIQLTTTVTEFDPEAEIERT